MAQIRFCLKAEMARISVLGPRKHSSAEVMILGRAVSRGPIKGKRGVSWRLASSLGGSYH